MAKKDQAVELKRVVTSVEEELSALEIIVGEMKKLDADAKMRVFGYLASRFTLYLRSDG